ncbi:MAG: ParA family protein [Deltaproteobacteria bacterium]|nr:ParA family protein [Deltaproteobacteria bacterium]
MGIKELLSEMEEIQRGTNGELHVLGYLLTMYDHTKMASETLDSLVANFGDKVFETRIRRTVKFKEAPALGRTIFHHAPDSQGAEDYLSLAKEVLERLDKSTPALNESKRDFVVVAGGAA